LGLTICRGIVEAHEGRIWVESKRRKGSTFAFALPLVPQDLATENLDAEMAEPRQETGKTHLPASKGPSS
jgi:two-component system sensor histidine kinase KdpD